MTKSNTDSAVPYSFDELAIWRTKLPQVKHAILPPDTNRPNPLFHQGMLYVSVFSSGAICALHSKTGKLVWRRELPSCGSDAAYFARGRLFARTANTLYALDPETGETAWSFCPYGESREVIYSHPTLYGNRLFIGDRRGYLHCLDFRTGETTWSVLTNTAKNCDVNSTPIVMKGLVIVATNANMAAAYDPQTGERIWLRKLDGPSISGPIRCGAHLVVITDSIYLIKPDTGKVIRKFSWNRDAVSRADCSARDVICILRGGWPPDGNTKLVRLNERGICSTHALTVCVASVRYAKQTKLIYISHLEGIDVRQKSGDMPAFRIERRKGSSGVSQVDVTASTIYALTGDGYAYALRHPPLKSR